VGYVPQAASLYRELSVSDHLALAARFRPAFDRPMAKLRLAQLDIPLDVSADELSGGQQAQVGLAIALGTRAPVLLLDEPLASLDPLARREFLHIMVDAVRETGATALLSSHVITDIEQACDRLLVLGGGRKLLDLSIAEARATHRVTDEGEATGGGRVVGRFPGPLGERLALVAGEGTRGRPATLEEIVLGHLAAGRVRPIQATGEVAA
jgi:ABC-2 type transport system ATP-binding protein